MVRAGLLAQAESVLCLELGAGKAWLSAWLALGLGVRNLLLVDSQSGFQKKVSTKLKTHGNAPDLRLPFQNAGVLCVLFCHITAVNSSSRIG
jgi:hypothetical protein